MRKLIAWSRVVLVKLTKFAMASSAGSEAMFGLEEASEPKSESKNKHPRERAGGGGCDGEQ